MTKKPWISDAEWEVMSVLWNDAPLPSSEVVARLAERIDWHPKTVKTLLGRLVQKGFLRFRRQGPRYLYSPKVSRQDCVRRETRTFLDRVFDGDPHSLLVHFVESGDLSTADIEELQQLLENKEAK